VQGISALAVPRPAVRKVRDIRCVQGISACVLTGVNKKFIMFIEIFGSKAVKSSDAAIF
jgi:hypothetical protein